MKMILWIRFLVHHLLTIAESAYIVAHPQRCEICNCMEIFHQIDPMEFEYCPVCNTTCGIKKEELERQENYKRRGKNEYGV